MAETLANLERRIHSASDLKEVVRTMKSLAAINIRPYEQAVRALSGYHRTVELGLMASFRDSVTPSVGSGFQTAAHDPAGFIVFGSDQGLVGQFNEQLAEYFLGKAAESSGDSIVLAIGERIYDRLIDSKLDLKPPYRVPDSVAGIIPLISQMLLDLEACQERKNLDQIFIFHNRPALGSLYEPVQHRLLPLDETWQAELKAKEWPTAMIPQVLPPPKETQAALVREYLFVCMFQACAESLASENACRLASMQRAEKNIHELLDQLQLQYHQQRQDAIDEELFDVVSGFEALSTRAKPTAAR